VLLKTTNPRQAIIESYRTPVVYEGIVIYKGIKLLVFIQC